MTAAELFEALSAPFDPKDIDWRVAEAGIKEKTGPWAIVVPYIDARAVMERLDSVVGPENWRDSYLRDPKGVMGKLEIRIGDEWVWKEDGSEETDIEGYKGAVSKALVRVAAKWGIGRYLYRFPTMFADFNEVKRDTPGANFARIKKDKGDSKGEVHYWLPPHKLPAWATPKETKEQKESERQERIANMPDLSSNPKHLQEQVALMCKARQIKPRELCTLVGDLFDVSSPKDLGVEQLQTLISHLEGNAQ